MASTEPGYSTSRIYRQAYRLRNFGVVEIDLDLSVEQLAALLTVPLIQIMLWEAGINRIGGPYLVDIARILGVSPGFFFEDFKPPTMR